MQIYNNLVAQVVLVVVPDPFHMEVAKSWLDTDRTDLIIVDKCFAETADQINYFLEIRGNNVPPKVNSRVRGFDHYYMRALPLRTHLGAIVREIGGEIEEIEFRMLEPETVAPHRDLPGVIEDFASHLYALLAMIGDLDNVKVNKAWAGAYPGGYLKDGCENFAKITFTFDTPFSLSSRTRGRAYVGQAVGHERETFLDLIGKGGVKKARIDLRGGDPAKDKRDISIYHKLNNKWQVYNSIASLPYIKPNIELFQRIALYGPGALELEECLFDVLTARKIVKLVEMTYTADNSRPYPVPRSHDEDWLEQQKPRNLNRQYQPGMPLPDVLDAIGASEGC